MKELKLFMESLPTKDYKRIKDEIIEGCFISESTWKNWLCGRTRVPYLAKPVINRIAKKQIYKESEMSINQ
jgi:hypothetical protein